MTTIETEYSEASAARRLSAVPLSHLSIELGHLYREDYEAGPDALRRHFAEIAPWVEAAHRAVASELPPGARPRISTCYLIDDYFAPFKTPATVVPALVDAAAAAGLRIDYLAREAACAAADGANPAKLTEERLVPEPVKGERGARPPTPVTGWLSNGQRSPSSGAQAMSDVEWKPPHETSARRHSIFVDVQLWYEAEGARLWSCPFLAAVWQLLRLGMLRQNGDPVLPARSAPEPLPDSWDLLPGLLKLEPRAAPFSAYRTVSVLAPRFLPVELAVRTVLSQVAVRNDVLEQIADRAAREGVDLRDEIVDRIEYLFVGGTVSRP